MATWIVGLVGVLSVAGLASAQDEAPPPIARPTSGEASLLSGRTLGTGEVMMAAGVGWPGIWLQLELAPSSTFNLGIRAALLYGSPLMALVHGAGAELAVPMRIHLFGEGEVDVAVYLTPAVALGEAALSGEADTVWAGAFGWSSRLEAGGVIGVRLMPRLTFFAGLGGHFAVVHTPQAGGPEAVGALLARSGIEGLISRDTMLFAEVQGGLGFTPGRGGQPVFRESIPPLLRVSLGVGYLF